METHDRTASGTSNRLSRVSSANVLTFVAVVSAATVIWLLAEQNRTLREALVEAPPGPAAARRLPEVGDPILSVALVGTDGRKADLAELVRDGAVVAFLTTTCRFCRLTVPVWTDLHERLRADSPVPFVAVSLHDPELTQQFSNSEALAWPLWAPEEREQRPSIRVSAVPVTALVAAGGEITRVWRGALRKEDVEEIVTAMSRRPLKKATVSC